MYMYIHVHIQCTYMYMYIYNVHAALIRTQSVVLATMYTEKRTQGSIVLNYNFNSCQYFRLYSMSCNNKQGYKCLLTMCLYLGQGCRERH